MWYSPRSRPCSRISFRLANFGVSKLSVKGQIGVVLGVVGQELSVAATHLCHCDVKAARRKHHHRGVAVPGTEQTGQLTGGPRLPLLLI